MEEPRDILLSLGECSWNRELNGYYIDMRCMVANHQRMYNSTFDKNGVPLIPIEGRPVYSPVNIAQYALAHHYNYVKQKNANSYSILNSCVGWCVKECTIDGEYAYWLHGYKNKYSSDIPWASAMAQGQMISLLLRSYQLNNDANTFALARKAFNHLQSEASPFQVCFRDNLGVWLEEFPSDPLPKVLNGYIYALLGVIDYFRATSDKRAESLYKECIQTLLFNIDNYDAGYWSFYDQRKRELVRYYYQRNVHALQLEIISMLSGEDKFRVIASKWRRQCNDLNFTLVKLMYRILPRVRKLKGMLTK